MAIVLTTLACNALLRPVVNTEPTDTEPVHSGANSDSQDVPTSPSEAIAQSTNAILPELTIPVESGGECDGHNWTFGPVALYRYPQSNGSDFVIVDFAIHNGSDRYWGIATITANSIYLISENNQWHQTIDSMETLEIPSIPVSPYSGTQYQRFNSSKFEQAIPPNFTLLGVLNPATGHIDHFTLGFRVPSAQKILTLYISDVQIECQITQTEFGYEDLSELTYSLNDFTQYTLPSPRDYFDLGSQPINVPNLGIFEFTGKSAEENLTVLQFSFTNTSDTSKSGSVLLYAIGHDGIYRSLDVLSAALKKYDGTFSTSPGRTVDINPIALRIPFGLSNLKIVFQVVVNNEVQEFAPPFSLAFHDVYNFTP